MRSSPITAVTGFRANVAGALALAGGGATQSPVPVQFGDDQPLKLEAASGVAERVNAPPLPKLLVHVAPQAMPLGLLVTTPAPSPALLTVTSTLSRVLVKVQTTAVPPKTGT